MAEATMDQAYQTWCLGNDGFVATRDPDEAIRRIEGFGLKARIVGQFQDGNGKTGVQLQAYNGDTVYYSGGKD